jgi:hypothetical protein
MYAIDSIAIQSVILMMVIMMMGSVYYRTQKWAKVFAVVPDQHETNYRINWFTPPPRMTPPFGL